MDIKIEYDDDGNEIPATPEEMKTEAIDRMRMLGIYHETVNQFKTDGLVSISEPPLFAHYWADDKLREVIGSFERRYNTLVFYGIKTVYQELGAMYALFYVSSSKSEWQLDRDDIQYAQQACCYVYVEDFPDNSEIGAVGFEHTRAASLRRTW